MINQIKKIYTFMQSKSFFKIILNSNEFLIPSDFNSLSDVDENIYSSLIKNHQYTVKSPASKEVLQSFINNWVSNEIPDINSENISLYSQLSEEFDRMKDLVQMFQRISPKRNFSSLLNKNTELKKTLSGKKHELKYLNKMYEHKNTLIFSNPSKQLYTKLHKHIWSYSINENDDSSYFVDLISKSGIELQNGLIFTFNYKEKTSGLLFDLNKQSHIFVPRSITFDSCEYLITIIHSYCFNCLNGLKTIEFPEDSELQIIGKRSFLNTELERISFPSSIRKINERAFNLCQKLKSIEFSDKIDSITFAKKSFQYLGAVPISIKANNVIIEKKAFENSKITQFSVDAKNVKINKSAFYFCSNIKKFLVSEETENLTIDIEVFARSSIECVSILAKNSFIGNNGFSDCDNLRKIEFSKHSESLTIDTFAFACTPVESIIFPSKRTQLFDNCFRNCENLKKVEFVSDLDYVLIQTSVFIDTPIQSIVIDSKNIELNDGWCHGTKNLTDVKISKNPKIKLYNNEFLIEKSNPKSDKYDMIRFARRDIVNVQIPSFIRIICESSFDLCTSIQKVEFLPNSELKIIDLYAFSFSSLRSIVIPPTVERIGKLSFFYCDKLKSIQFCENSKLNVIEKNAFDNSSLESLSIPSSITQLESGFSTNIKYLTDIKVLQNDVKNIQFFDNNFIIGKIDIFDVLYFARRDISFASIPSFIKIICQYAFQFCRYLKMVDISPDSQIEEIEEYSFAKSSLGQFFIPRKLTKVDKYAFDECNNLQIVEFDENWTLTSLDLAWFNGSSLNVVMIPAKLRNNLDNLPGYVEEVEEVNDDDDDSYECGTDFNSLFG